MQYGVQMNAGREIAVRLAEKRLNVDGLSYIMLRKEKTRMAGHRAEILNSARQEVINADNFMTLREEPVTEVRANEAGTTRD
jgi:hypothetical protein